MYEKNNAISCMCIAKIDYTCPCRIEKRKELFRSILCINTGIIGTTGMSLEVKII